MSNSSQRTLANAIAKIAKSIKDSTRSAQLGNSSVRKPGGGEALIANTAEVASDAVYDISSLTDYTDGVSEIGDNGAEYHALVPDWIDTTADTANYSFELAAEAGERVTVALEEANKAADDAANALTTANGKNARRRGITEPAPPPGGWVPGDQWIRDAIDSTGAIKPVEVLVWNGTAFVQEQILASELLVVGENGVVRIADGKVTAPALAVDALDFKTGHGVELIGGKITGGEINLANIVASEVIYSDDAETLANWSTIVPDDPTKPPQVKPTLSTIKVSGNYSVKGEAIAGVSYTPTTHSTKQGNVVEVWLRTNVAQTLWLSAFPHIGRRNLGAFKANIWQKVTLEFEDAKAFYIGFAGTVEGSDIYVDSFKFSNVRTTTSSGLKIHRDSLGIAQLESYTGNYRARLQGGKLLFDQPNYPNIGAEYSATGTSLHSVSVMDEEPTAIAMDAGWYGPFVWFKRGAAQSRISLREDEVLEFDGKVRFNDGFKPVEITDWNNAMSTGFYYGTNAANGPVTNWLAGVVTTYDTGNRVLQEVREAKATTHSVVHRRYYHGTGWTDWTTDNDRDLWVKRNVTGLTWAGSGNGWQWTAGVRVTFPAGKFSKIPYLGGVHTMADGVMIFAMVMAVQQTYFEVRFLKYGATALSSARLEYSAHER